MNSLLLFLVRLLDFYTIIVFFYVVVSWLFHFNILNNQNVFLWRVFESFKKLTDPPLNYIRRYLPNFGGLDISPPIKEAIKKPCRIMVSSMVSIEEAGTLKEF